MKSIRQLLRQPGKTAAGIVLVALAVSVLCICVGQAFAAANAQAALDKSCTTVALQTVDYQYETVTDSEGRASRVFSLTSPQAVEDWIGRTVEEHPELVESVASHGLASAYIPELTPDNYTGYICRWVEVAGDDSYRLVPDPAGAPYSCALLEVTLTDVGAPEETGDQLTVALSGVVERALSLQEGFHDPAGYTAHLTLTLPDQASWEALELAADSRCLVWGMDYRDEDWELRSYISYRANDGELLDELDPACLFMLPQTSQARGIVARYTHASQFRPVQSVMLNGEQLALFRAVSLTASPAEGPGIVPLSGSAEEFLASDQGASWRTAMELAAVNNQAFPMIGVDGLEYVAAFAQETARITAGRDFTREELTAGASVCVMSAHLAQANGLAVGDVIHPAFYAMDGGCSAQSLLADGTGTVNPAAHFYTGGSLTASEDGYTIVGLYDQDDMWGTVTPYSFTPNTVFVPKTSVPVEMEYGSQGFFRTIVLKNGVVPQFRALTEAAGYDDLFLYYDQGYTVTTGSLYSYRSTVKQSLMVGFVVYGIVLLLFLPLFPGSQGGVIDRMGTMGAGRTHKVGHLLAGSLGILLPGTAIGLLAGRLLWESVVNALMDWSGAAPPITLDGAGLGLIAAGQLALALLAVLLLSLFFTRQASLLRRR